MFTAAPPTLGRHLGNSWISGVSGAAGAGGARISPTQSLTTSLDRGLSLVWENEERSILCHRLLQDARLFGVLKQFDEDMAARVHASRCPVCGGRLDVSNYARKPRGGPPGHDLRLSFCCAVEGCRRRATPPSVRFLARKVYLAAVVVLCTAMQQGLSSGRVRRLREDLGVSYRTLCRWRYFWTEAFATSPFWLSARGRLARPILPGRLPAALLEAMGWTTDEAESLKRLLRFIAPITTRPHLCSRAT